MKGKLHKGTVLLGLCSLSFYCGAQITGQTEAAFSSQAQIKPVELSAAIVFPDTVGDLNGKAKIIYSDILSLYNTVPNAADDASLQELKQTIEEITGLELTLHSLLHDFEDIHNELLNYEKRVRNLDSKTYQFVYEGCNEANELSKKIKETVKLQSIKQLHHSIEVRINKLEDAEKKIEDPVKSAEMKNTTDHIEQNELADHSIQSEGETKHDEKTVEIHN
ncbi:DUF4047 domain-containing protein [Fictibacillus norfolkensis]|uniref:DUF4047 domain-containing protein n=1 Tax=Fictibacillus norfolkensis TaxID=2762233 RepID=A0ABR8SNV5_9BACL|nr:DUF4047 domain-containing protein [Fictibacillus norfolkensis]MBD7965185.1 DUF4047 domain-containing protein [Fictibacillus norfolkensis]